MMTAGTWEITQHMHEQGVLKQPIDVKTAYTLVFLNEIFRTGNG